MSNTRSFSGATMTPEGMKFNGAIFHPIVEKCESCNRIREFDGCNYCSSYAVPVAKWAIGNCNFATHVKIAASAQTKVNPLKASKRAAKGGR